MYASIQKVISVEPIENADAIEKVKVLGWQVVCKKGQFKTGDLVIFISIDTVLPSDNPAFSFLEKNHYRIKTIKLKQTLSQGICFPMSILPEGEWKEGDDVAEILHIQHYIKPVPGGLAGENKGNFPSFLHKSNEERLQNFPDVLKELEYLPYYITVKVDGSSGTFYYKDGVFGVCSRNLEKKETEGNYFWKVAKKYDMEKKLQAFGKNIALQGEVCGPGIQKNHLNLPDTDVFIFNIYDIDDGRYMNMAEVSTYCHQWGIPMVPIEEINPYFTYTSVESLLEKAKGKYPGTNNNREGIVVRPMLEKYSQVMKGRMSFKIVNNEYLLKEEE